MISIYVDHTNSYSPSSSLAPHVSLVGDGKGFFITLLNSRSGLQLRTLKCLCTVYFYPARDSSVPHISHRNG